MYLSPTLEMLLVAIQDPYDIRRVYRPARDAGPHQPFRASSNIHQPHFKPTPRKASPAALAARHRHKAQRDARRITRRFAS